MSLPFTTYAKIKDKVCIGYFGPAEEHLVQLRALRPNIESRYPGIEVYLACRDEHMGNLNSQSNVISLSQLRASRGGFGMVYELVRDMESHPIEQFCELSDIPFKVEITLLANDSSKCLILPDGEHPTVNMTSSQINSALQLAQRRGYKPEFGDDFTNAGWVIGVECPRLYEAALAGIKTSLVPTGLGTALFQKMFPGYELIKL